MGKWVMSASTHKLLHAIFSLHPAEEGRKRVHLAAWQG